VIFDDYHHGLHSGHEVVEIRISDGILVSHILLGG
jgi:hypothetical protein